MYEHTDKVLRGLNKQFIRLFRKINLLNIDELNVVNQVVSVYKKADKLARKAYLDVAIFAYLFAAKEANYDVKEAPIDEDWVQDMLFEADPVTLYKYMPEWSRKRQRLIEALAATKKPRQEANKALKYMVMQTSHYADKATARATLQAYKDAGVKRVIWQTERDNKVCPECAPLDGKVFDIDKVPQIPSHYRCRCTVKPVKD